MKALKLVLKRKFYDMIDSGEKLEEYRDVTPYWATRIENVTTRTIMGCLGLYRNVRFFDDVEFYCGYAKDRRSMRFRIWNIRIGYGKPEWGAEPGKKYYVIELGKRLK